MPSKSTVPPATSVADDPDRLLEVAIVVGGLPSTRRAESPRPMPRSIRPPESSSSVASDDAVTDGSRVAGFVTHVPEPEAGVASAISVSRGYGSRHSTWLSNSQPWSKPAASAWRVSASVRSIVWSGLSVNPNCTAARSPPSGSNEATAYTGEGGHRGLRPTVRGPSAVSLSRP